MQRECVGVKHCRDYGTADCYEVQLCAAVRDQAGQIFAQQHSTVYHIWDRRQGARARVCGRSVGIPHFAIVFALLIIFNIGDLFQSLYVVVW